MSLQVETYSLPRITSGASGQAAITMLNAPVIAAEQALNDLSTRIGSLNQKSAIIRHYVPISSDVGVGTLVYYNNTTGHCRFEPALAKLLSTPGSQGESIEDPMSRVEGLIISVDSSTTTGTMLCGGYWESTAVAQACLGSAAVAGTYYLSPTNAGKATTDPGYHLRQAILSYYGDGKLNLNVFYMAHDNHFHGSAIFANAWKAASSITGITPPTGANWVYDHPADTTNCANIGEMSATTTAVVYNGLVQTTGTGKDFIIDNGYVWSTLTTAPAASSVVIFNHYPFAYNSPVIRSIESLSDSLAVTTKSGVVQLQTNAFISGSTNKSPLAISAIADNVLQYTPVVTAVQRGAGITVDTDTDGTVVVSASNLIGTPIDAYGVSHNGTNVISDGLYQYISFPTGRSCSFAMTLPVQDVPTGTTLKAVVWGEMAGVGASLSVDIYYIEHATTTATSVLPSSPQVSGILALPGSSGALTYAETSVGATITKAGMVMAVVSLNNTTSHDVKLYRTGFKLSVVSTEEQDTDRSTPIESTMAITGQMEAGYSASKYDIVYVQEGKLQLCRGSVVGTANMCVGVTLASANTGDVVSYIMSGLIQDPSFNFTPGQPLYVGANGRISQTVESGTAYTQKIGMAMTSAIAQISIETAVITE